MFNVQSVYTQGGTQKGGAISETVSSGGVKNYFRKAQNSSACSCNHHENLYWETAGAALHQTT